MTDRVRELCRRLKPVLGARIDALWTAYLSETQASGKADIEQTLELLAAKHLGLTYEPDRSPFPPPSQAFAAGGDVAIGQVSYGNRDLYPFLLRSARLKEHILVFGRSGSGKTNLTFVLMQGIMERGIKVVALDWKRGYRDLLPLVPDLRIYTVGRGISPFRFNPLIPPQGWEPGTWIKLIVDVIASAYLGGEGVISLLVSGLHHLYSKYGIFDGLPTQWPTIVDLLAWLRTVKLKGRAAMWQASAERILLAMTYGEFGAVVNTQDNSHVAHLLDDNVVLEMDGLSSASDRAMFSEALTLYLYRHRLAQGPRSQLTNLIVLEEAHHILARRAVETKESVLETSIRMIRQYGIGYVFVDQSASLLSKVALANSYATIALSQKLRADVQTISSAMNLTDEQRDALSTLPVGSAVVRLADGHPEPFLVNVPRCPIQEGSVSDEMIRNHMGAHNGDTGRTSPLLTQSRDISVIPVPDKKRTKTPADTHPPSPYESQSNQEELDRDSGTNPPLPELSREAIRFLNDVAARPLSTTVSRYQRLNLSRRRGNAVRQALLSASLIEPTTIATRSGQTILYELTSAGEAVCERLGIDPTPRGRMSLEHAYWQHKAAEHFRSRGFDVALEESIPGDGFVDVVAERPGERIAVEIETGRSDIDANLLKTRKAPFDATILVATSPEAITQCQKAIDRLDAEHRGNVQVLSWLDFS